MRLAAARGCRPAGVENLLHVGSGPFLSPCERRDEGAAQVGEFILDPWGDLRCDGAGDQAVFFQPTEGLGEHFLRNPIHPGFKLAESLGAVLQCADDEHGPPVADAVEEFPGGAISVVGVPTCDV